MYSWIFEAILCLLVLAANLVSGPESLKLPWNNPHLTAWMVGLALLGLLLVLLAMAGRLRLLLFLFSIYVVYVLFTGFFVNVSYVFAGPADARNTAILVAGAVLAMIGAWPMAIKRRAAISSRVR